MRRSEWIWTAVWFIGLMFLIIFTYANRAVYFKRDWTSAAEWVLGGVLIVWLLVLMIIGGYWGGNTWSTRFGEWYYSDPGRTRRSRERDARRDERWRKRGWL